MPRRLSNAVTLTCLCAPLLSGCAIFGFGGGTAPADGTEATYRAAMADFSDCQTAPDAAARAAAAARLAAAAAEMQAVARPSNPDHFYMTDRVTAAAASCTGATAR